MKKRTAPHKKPPVIETQVDNGGDSIDAPLAELRIPIEGSWNNERIVYQQQEFRAAAKARRPLSPTIAALGGKGGRALREVVSCSASAITAVVYFEPGDGGSRGMFESPEALGEALIRRLECLEKAVEEQRMNRTPLAPDDEIRLGHLAAISGKPGQGVELRIGATVVDISPLAEAKAVRAYTTTERRAVARVVGYRDLDQVDLRQPEEHTKTVAGIAEIRVVVQPMGRKPRSRVGLGHFYMNVTEADRDSVIDAVKDRRRRQIILAVAEKPTGQWCTSGHLLIQLFEPDAEIE